MKKDKYFAIRTLVIACLFFFVGKLVFFRLFSLFEPTIEDIHFQITERPDQFPTSILFSIMLIIVTLLVAIIWRLGHINSTTRRTGVVITIALFMIAGILFRHQLVKNYFNGVVRPFLQSKKQLPMNYPIDPANFVYYMFAGCCIGCVFSFFLLRQKVAN